MRLNANSRLFQVTLALLVSLVSIPARADHRDRWPGTTLEIDEAELPIVVVTLQSLTHPEHTRSFRFMFDTGAATTVLDTSIPPEFYWDDIVPTVPLYDNTGKAADASSVFVKRLTVGGMTRDTIPAVRMDLKKSMLGRFQDQPMDGILGMSFMRGMRFTYNPVKRWIEWWNVAQTGLRIPIEYRLEVPFIRVKLGKSLIPCRLDTGAGGVGLLLPAAFKPSGSATTAAMMGTLTNQGAGLLTCRVDRVEAGGPSWRNVEVDFQEGGEWGLIGQAILSVSPVNFDFVNNYLTLVPNAKGDLPIRTNKTIVLPIAWDRETLPARLVVLAIRPDTALERAGIKVGDQILSADGVEGEALKRRTLIEALARKGSHSWTISRNGQVLKMTFQ